MRWLDGGLVGVPDHRPAFRGELGFGLGQPAQLAVEHGGGHRPGAAAIAPAALRRIGTEHNGDGRQAGLAREPGVDPPPLRVEAERVDDRVQAAPQPGRDDLVEQGEGVGGRVQIVLAAADHAAQLVGGDDLGLPVPGRCPG